MNILFGNSLLASLLLLILISICNIAYADNNEDKNSNFYSIFHKLGDVNYCYELKKTGNHSVIYAKSWSCVIFDSFFPVHSREEARHSILSVLSMSIAYFVYYIAFIFFIYFILRLMISSAYNGVLLSNTEDNSVFVRFIIGLFLLFPTDNYNSLVIHKIVFGIVNISISVSDEVMSQYSNTQLMKKSEYNNISDKEGVSEKNGWAKQLFKWSNNFITNHIVNNDLKEFQIITSQVALEPGIIYESYLGIFYGFIPAMSFGSLGGPSKVNSTKAVKKVNTAYSTIVGMLYGYIIKIFNMMLGLIGWLPILIYMIGIPLVATFTFISIYIAWLYACFELMLFAPFICLALMWPFIGSDSFLGKTLPILYLSIWIIFAPSLIIIAYPLISLLINFSHFIISQMIGSPFEIIKQSLSGLSGFNILVPEFDLKNTAMSLFYTMLIFNVVMKCFRFLRNIMTRFMMIMGDSFGVQLDAFYSIGDKTMSLIRKVATRFRAGVVGGEGINRDIKDRK